MAITTFDIRERNCLKWLWCLSNVKRVVGKKIIPDVLGAPARKPSSGSGSAIYKYVVNFALRRPACRAGHMGSIRRRNPLQSSSET